MATRDQNEAELRASIARWSEALRSRDLDRLMAGYATEIVAYDVIPPLQYAGVDAYRKSLRDWFASHEGPIVHELTDIAICAGDDVAFTHALVRIAVTPKSGGRAEARLRWTAGWHKVRGHWLVVHEHVSAPYDMKTMRAVTDAPA